MKNTHKKVVAVVIVLLVTPYAKCFLVSSILRLMNPSICQLIAYPESTLGGYEK
jgi:hypothetical protein